MGDSLYQGEFNGLGHPIAARSSARMAGVREPLVRRERLDCAVCREPLLFGTWGLCTTCVLKLPDTPDGLRATLQRYYQPGVRPDQQRPEWQNALRDAVALLTKETPCATDPAACPDSAALTTSPASMRKTVEPFPDIPYNRDPEFQAWRQQIRAKTDPAVLPKDRPEENSEMGQKPDPVTSKDAGGNFEPHSEGTHPMLCADVIDFGLRLDQFPGQPVREVPKVGLVFVSGERNDDGSLRLVSVEMTNSMGEKANLRKFLQSWRGKSYTAEQAEAGVPLDRLYGQTGLLTIEHKRAKGSGRTFANIASISPLPKAMGDLDHGLLEEYERPQFFTDRKAAYADEVKKYRHSVGADNDEPEFTGGGDEDEDLPFD